MDISVNSNDEKHKKRGMIISILTHVVFLILLLIPILRYPDPPPGQEGITVNLGMPEFDEIEQAAPSAPATEPQPEEEEVQEEQAQPDPPQPEPQPIDEPEVVEQEDPDQIALKKQQEEARQERLREEREEQARREARRKAEEERKRKEAEAAENKERISDLFKNSDGKGEGDKQSGGDPDGEPDTGALESISTGSGKVGGDLAGRGRPTFSPRVTDDSQKQGTVVINVCVDADGSVVSARFTQRGSTTNDATLKNLAVANAKRWKFPKGSGTDCGTITYTFKVK